MYGGHITDDWDRRLCRTYLEEYMKPEMVKKSCLHFSCYLLLSFYLTESSFLACIALHCIHCLL